MNASRQRVPIRFGSVVHETAAVIFDKDGVLFEHASLFTQLHALRRDHLRTRCGSLLAEAYDATVGVVSDGVRENVIDPGGPLAMAPIEHELVILAALLYRETRRPWLECIATARTIFADADRTLDLTQIAPLPGFPEVLIRLKDAGIVVGVVTSDQRERSARQLSPFRVEHVLDFLAAGDDTPFCKPDARVLHHSLSPFGVHPADAVMVGDTANDWIMAQQAGARAVAVGATPTPAIPHDTLADTRVDTLLTTISTIAEIQLCAAEPTSLRSDR